MFISKRERGIVVFLKISLELGHPYDQLGKLNILYLIICKPLASDKIFLKGSTRNLTPSLLTLVEELIIIQFSLTISTSFASLCYSLNNMSFRKQTFPLWCLLSGQEGPNTNMLLKVNQHQDSLRARYNFLGQ